MKELQRQKQICGTEPLYKSRIPVPLHAATSWLGEALIAQDIGIALVLRITDISVNSSTTGQTPASQREVAPRSGSRWGASVLKEGATPWEPAPEER